jgi:hypothetical protein
METNAIELDNNMNDLVRFGLDSEMYILAIISVFQECMCEPTPNYSVRWTLNFLELTDYVTAQRTHDPCKEGRRTVLVIHQLTALVDLIYTK